jgi:hypothetical protein
MSSTVTSNADSGSGILQQSTWERLQKSFVEDHRAMTRGYQELIGLLTAGDWVAASQAASRLDRIAGPHIEFEEKYLYPQVAKSRGNRYISRLYDEHDEAVTVLGEILQAGQPARPADEKVAGWIERLRHGIDHASACGTMLGELKSLPEAEQRRFLDGMTRLREKGARWTELQGLHT